MSEMIYEILSIGDDYTGWLREKHPEHRYTVAPYTLRHCCSVDSLIGFIVNGDEIRPMVIVHRNGRADPSPSSTLETMEESLHLYYGDREVELYIDDDIAHHLYVDSQSNRTIELLTLDGDTVTVGICTHMEYGSPRVIEMSTQDGNIVIGLLFHNGDPEHLTYFIPSQELLPEWADEKDLDAIIKLKNDSLWSVRGLAYPYGENYVTNHIEAYKQAINQYVKGALQ